MPIPIPENPQYPDPKLYDNPHVRLLPLVNPEDGWWKRVRNWLFKRPEYIVIEDYFTWVPYLGAWVFIPKNFVFDYASTPKIIGFAVRPTGVLAHGAGPHDFGYRFQGLLMTEIKDTPYRFENYTRKEIDQVFKSLNNKSTGLGFVNGAATAAVSLFGRWKIRDINEVDWSEPVRKTK